MAIIYKVNQFVTTEAFTSLLKASGLAERRPVEDAICMQGMVENSNLIISAWLIEEEQEKLVGIARSMTDFHYACYLSDLAVDKAYQKQGLGKNLIAETQAQLRATCKLILIAAPDANGYYPKLGFQSNDRCWVLN